MLGNYSIRTMDVSPDFEDSDLSLYEFIKKTGEIKLLIRQIETKFSEPIPEKLQDKIVSADREQLNALTDSMFEIKTLDEVKDILEE